MTGEPRQAAPPPVLQVPPELKALDQWVLWRAEGDPNNPRKVPYRPDGYQASVSDPKTWSSFRKAHGAYQKSLSTDSPFAGIGWVFSSSDPFAGFDFDDCLDESGKLKPWADGLVAALDSYAEISPSGTGIKIWVKGSLKGRAGVKIFLDKQRNRVPKVSDANYDGAIELYDNSRYFAFTGKRFPGSPLEVNDRQGMVDEAYGVIQKAQKANVSSSQSSGPSSFSVPSGVGKGDRHRTLISAAASLRAKGFGESAIYAGLKEVNDSFDEPKADYEINKIARDFAKKPAGRSAENLAAFPERPDRPQEPAPSTASNPEPTAQDNDDIIPMFSPREAVAGEVAMKANDMGRMVLQKHAIIVDASDAIFEYTGKYWKNILESRLRSYAMEEDSQTFTSTARRSQTADFIMSRVRQEEINWRNLADNEVPCNNGVVNVDTHMIRPHRKTDFLETTIPVNYDPEARCYLWEACLAQWFKGDPDHGQKISAIQEFFGYVLLPHARFKKALFLHGEGDTGKSQVAITLGHLVGKDNKITISTKDMDDPQKRAPIVGKMLNLLTELPASAMISDGGFKQLVSTGDPIQIDPKHRAGFAYAPFCKHLIATNRLPSVNDTTNATFNRMLLVYFPNIIKKEEQDRSLEGKLRAELPGILMWSLEGAARLVRQHGEFTLIPSSRETITEYRDEQNPITPFLDEECVIRREDNGIVNKISLRDLRNKYVRWNNNRHIESRLLNNLLKAAGLQVGPRKDSAGKSVRSVIGVRWKTADEIGREEMASIEPATPNTTDGSLLQ